MSPYRRLDGFSDDRHAAWRLRQEWQAIEPRLASAGETMLRQWMHVSACCDAAVVRLSIAAIVDNTDAMKSLVSSSSPIQ